MRIAKPGEKPDNFFAIQRDVFKKNLQAELWPLLPAEPFSKPGNEVPFS